MKVSKYLIIEDRGLEQPVVFSPLFTHDQFGLGKHVVSGGFCYRKDDGTFGVHGKSMSLKVESRRADIEILNRFLEYET